MNPITITPTERSVSASHHACQLPARDVQDLLPAPPIDSSLFHAQCLGDLDFAATLLEMFETTSSSRLKDFEAALAEGNYDAIAENAHALRGVAGILGATTLIDVCSNLGSNSSRGDRGQTHDLIQTLLHEIQRVIDFIPNMRQK